MFRALSAARHSGFVLIFTSVGLSKYCGDISLLLLMKEARKPCSVW